MNEILQKIVMNCGGKFLEDGAKRGGMWVFTESDLQKLIDVFTIEKNKEIDQLKSQLFTAKAQNSIYEGAVHDHN